MQGLLIFGLTPYQYVAQHHTSMKHNTVPACSKINGTYLLLIKGSSKCILPGCL